MRHHLKQMAGTAMVAAIVLVGVVDRTATSMMLMVGMLTLVRRQMGLLLVAAMVRDQVCRFERGMDQQHQPSHRSHEVAADSARAGCGGRHGSG
jgi:hypothetical protein